ncbi:hypothetical protein PVAP13_1NG438919 [Panicum virgatum]|uniref:Uncharacterized protein n=1 Tax=Panicum virgatum TaxID=38727 RepID=A0A8T0WVK1_PANVG|nr:hypothetical protein PVAP13_1NG438919 [Panicum virgatum]
MATMLEMRQQSVLGINFIMPMLGRWWWIAPNLYEGYLYYYYLVLAVICLKNSVAYVLLCCKHGKYGWPPFFPCAQAKSFSSLACKLWVNLLASS